MTRAARIVLQDAKHAIARHTETLQAEEFRASWFAVIGLLRAVGHVLDKVDAKSSPMLEQAIRTKWNQLSASRPEPTIFWDFIHAERNRFLKSYEHGIDRTITIPTLSGLGSIKFDGGNARGGWFAAGHVFNPVITSGSYAGQNERTVALAAHHWWADYLNEVDRLAMDE
jgi:hypothetical protein